MVYSGMNRYSKGKIYKVVDIGHNKMYIGSTVESLSKRMERHRSKYKEYLRGDGDNTRVYWLFDEFGVENCKIELIENYPCNSREELEAQEGKHQQSNKCINKVIAGRTVQEYLQDEYDYISFQKKIYRELHPEQRKGESQRRYEKLKHILSEKYICECGSITTLRSKSKHNKTQKHQDWLKEQEQE